MGQEILYCFKCQERVTSGDLDSSNALRFGNRVACKKCVPDLIATLSAQERKELVSRVQSSSTDRRASGFTPRPRQVVPSPRRSTTNPAAWIAIAVVGVAVVLGVVVFAMSGSPPVEPIPKDPPRPVSKGPEESPRERAAREALARAKAVPSSNLEGQIAAFADALKVTEGTSHHREAREMVEGLLEMRRKAMLRELAAVDERAKVTVQKEEFGAAIAIYEAIRPLRAEPEWKSMVDAKVGDVRKVVDLAYGPLKEQAAAARGKGAEEEVQRLRERVFRWGFAEKTADLDAHLLTIAPPKDADTRPWIPLFDGKTLDFLTSNGEGAWTVENGAIHHVKGKNTSAQSKRQFANGEIRIRFASRNLEGVGFAIRQGSDGAYSVFLDRAQLAAIEGRDHELLIVFRAGEVSAMLDGKETLVEARKTPLKGHLQFNCEAGDLWIRSIDYRNDPLYDGLAGWWTFDALKDGLAADSSGNNNNGKAMESPALVPGKIGSALQFDGRRSFILVPSSPNLNPVGPFSITAWVKLSVQDGSSPSILEKWDDANKMGFYLRLSGRGQLLFAVRQATSLPDVVGQRVLSIDEWTFVTAVYDGDAMKVYCNGTLDKNNPLKLTLGPTPAPLIIARGGGGGSHYWPGIIDDVRLYHRALTPDEIARLAK